VAVAAGTYPETVTVAASGTSGSPISFVGTGLPTVNFFNLNGSYITVSGFNLAGPGNPGSGSCTITVNGDHGFVHDCTWTNATWDRGVQMAGAFGVLSNCLWTTSVTGANAGLWAGFQTSGHDILIISNIMANVPDNEAVGLVWGYNITIAYNLVTNCLNPGYDSPGTHADFLQTFALNSGSVSSNVVVNGNRIVDSNIQCIMANGANPGIDPCPGMCNWYYHNNIFQNSWQSGFVYMPGVVIANNLFTNWGWANGYSFTFNDGSPSGYGYGTNGACKNNVFFSWNVSEPYVREVAVAGDYNATDGASLPDGTHNVINANLGFVGGSPYSYALQSTSPLKDAGTTLSEFSADVLGVSRPQGSAWDIGPYEYSSGGGTAPTITVAPANTTVAAGSTATFSVTATGTATLSYQWTWYGTNVSGATSSSWTTPPTTALENGSTVGVTVSNSYGSAGASATLTVTGSGAATPSGPGIITGLGVVSGLGVQQ